MPQGETIVQKDYLSLAGKTALVTGASGGLGEHFAKTAARAGAATVVTARRIEKLNVVVAAIHEAGGRAVAVAMDVTDAASVEAGFDAAERHFGTVDVLINNAGVANRSRICTEMSDADWDFVMNTNLTGAWRVARTAARRLKAAQQPGSIVNIASIYGLGVGTKRTPYMVSKAGVVQMTRSMAIDLIRDRIRVNALCPGYFATAMLAELDSEESTRKFLDTLTPRRFGNLHELDAPLLLLAGDAGSFINGVALPVDGGHLLKPI